MENKILALLLLVCATAAASAGDVPHYAQIDMKAPPVNPTNVTTKDYVDTADSELETKIDGAVFYDADGNISYPAGLSLQVKMPDGTKKDVLATDTNGNALLGEADIQVNITASARPTMTIAGGAADGIATLTDLADFVSETDLDAEMAYKADLVGGVVPDAQLPAHVKVTNWGPVAAETDLVTLTAATVNDRAFVGAAPGPYTTYYLLAMPPTTQTNWIQAGGGGSGTSGVESVNGDTGPAVTVDLAQFPDVQAALDDKADAADLALLAPLASPALTGTPTAPTAPANAVGSQIINADALRTAMTGNLGATNPLMDGTATAGLATTVARSDHVHPTDTTRAPLNSPTFVGTPKAPTAPAGTATTQLATTEFVATAIEEADTTMPAAFAMVPDYTNMDPTEHGPGPWTADKDGFVLIDCGASSSSMGLIAYINGKRVFYGVYQADAVLPISAGDVISISFSGSGRKSIFYIPPKYIPVNRQYSTDEQSSGETWIDGELIWKQTISFTSSSVENSWNVVANYGPGYFAQLIKVEGVQQNSDGNWAAFPLSAASSSVTATTAVQINPTTGEVEEYHSGLSGSAHVLTLYYTKP